MGLVMKYGPEAPRHIEVIPGKRQGFGYEKWFSGVALAEL